MCPFYPEYVSKVIHRKNVFYSSEFAALLQTETKKHTAAISTVFIKKLIKFLKD